MKHIDDQIREVFSKKLSNAEADVSPHLWEAVQSQIAAGSGTGAVATVAKVISTKLIVAASVAVIAVASVVYFSVSEKSISQKESAVQSKMTPNPVLESNSQTIDSTNDPAKPTIQNEEPQKVQDVRIEQSNGKEVQSTSSEINSSTEFSIISEKTASSHSNTKEESRPAMDENQMIKGSAIEATNALTGVFKVLPVDIEEMRYSFQSQEAAASYEWNFGDDTLSNEDSPIHQFTEEGNYIITLTVTDESGLKKTTSHEMNVYKPGKTIIPNIFTPNGDGSNDTFDPSAKSEGVTFTRIVVQDSQGKVVFESNSQLPWDGTDPSGSPCNSGTYQYYVSGFDRNQEILENKGVVTLIR